MSPPNVPESGSNQEDAVTAAGADRPSPPTDSQPFSIDRRRNSVVNVHRITRIARWRASLALIMVAALALTTGVALGSAPEWEGNDPHGSDRELRPRGDVRRQQCRQGGLPSRPVSR